MWKCSANTRVKAIHHSCDTHSQKQANHFHNSSSVFGKGKTIFWQKNTFIFKLLNFIRKAFGKQWMFAPNTLSLQGNGPGNMLTGHVGHCTMCSSRQSGLIFLLKQYDFPTAYAFKADHPGKADILIDKVVSQHQVYIFFCVVNVTVLQLYSESQ